MTCIAVAILAFGAGVLVGVLLIATAHKGEDNP